MDSNAELREFLRTRRARLQPEAVGLSSYGGRRRVPGLRREELAQLAGVSFDYYVRLEQGRSLNASDSVLDAISAALRLSPTERAHLFDLARRRGDGPQKHETPGVRPGLRRLIEAISGTPAFLLNRRFDVVAWNDLAAALIVDWSTLPRPDRNLPRFLFLDERARSIYADWPGAAGDSVATLRMAAGRNPDAALNALIGELSVKSREFGRLWARHDVKERSHGVKRFLHAIAGEITVSYEALHLPADPGMTLMIYTVEAGSPSAAAMQRLIGLVDSRRRHRSQADSAALEDHAVGLKEPAGSPP